MNLLTVIIGTATSNFSQVLLYSTEDDDLLKYEVPNSTIVGVFWDKEDSRVLVCEVNAYSKQRDFGFVS